MTGKEAPSLYYVHANLLHFPLPLSFQEAEERRRREFNRCFSVFSIEWGRGQRRSFVHHFPRLHASPMEWKETKKSGANKVKKKYETFFEREFFFFSSRVSKAVASGESKSASNVLSPSFAFSLGKLILRRHFLTFCGSDNAPPLPDATLTSAPTHQNLLFLSHRCYTLPLSHCNSRLSFPPSNDERGAAAVLRFHGCPIPSSAASTDRPTDAQTLLMRPAVCQAAAAEKGEGEKEKFDFGQSKESGIEKKTAKIKLTPTFFRRASLKANFSFTLSSYTSPLLLFFLLLLLLLVSMLQWTMLVAPPALPLSLQQKKKEEEGDNSALATEQWDKNKKWRGLGERRRGRRECSPPLLVASQRKGPSSSSSTVNRSMIAPLDEDGRTGGQRGGWSSRCCTHIRSILSVLL